MRIDELLAGPGPVFSFEFFPPRTEQGEQNLYAALRELGALEPSFVSVTYGAGGSTREKTIEIVKRIKRDHGLEAMAHFTCVGATVGQLRGTLDEMAGAGIENVLALRGDPPAGQESWVKTDGGLEYSSELVELIRADYPFAIGAACFPETHIHASSPEADLEHLAEKVGAGVDFLITQLFFDNRCYFDFLARARALGIEVPIIPGIMPITQIGQIERMAAMCGASIPNGLRRELHLREDSPEAVLDFGVAYATLQCAELLAAGAPAIHFYTLNRSPATRAILGALKLARPWEQAPAETGYADSISSPSATRGEPSGAS
jgi:methylenetetrahydrofolate reductase (NADPH)